MGFPISILAPFYSQFSIQSNSCSGFLSPSLIPDLIHVQVHVYMSVWRPKDDDGCFLSHCAVRWVPSPNWQVQLARSPTESPIESSCVCLPSTGTRGACHHTWPAFTRESKLRSLGLCSKCFTNLTHLLAIQRNA